MLTWIELNARVCKQFAKRQTWLKVAFILSSNHNQESYGFVPNLQLKFLALSHPFEAHLLPSLAQWFLLWINTLKSVSNISGLNVFVVSNYGFLTFEFSLGLSLLWFCQNNHKMFSLDSRLWVYKICGMESSRSHSKGNPPNPRVW